ncbi:hypothetical protein JDV02_000352 [Purpureocillium takamizusanense]|uniref:Clr5 domain-containing protein n=1 Tax=Purpureocillium takamizusanense TaxID=2060973 RepID=A0A9Q8Q720_9HYPO|nr:uncharacterized protein JDV02_000352 [Purpureocillium takamizusanense]UNI13627.1 hypothetical protein JDV02_000352 [Purpureocillium takamizusanense]
MKDWDRHQEEIVELYQLHKLGMVMEIMTKKYGFRACRRSYMEHLSKWGARKYNQTVRGDMRTKVMGQMLLIPFDSGPSNQRSLPQDWQSSADQEIGSEFSRTSASQHFSASNVLLQRADQYISQAALLLIKAMPLGGFSSLKLERLIQDLPNLLTTFALKIGRCATTSMHREVMYFMLKHRKDIIDQFRSDYTAHEAKDSPLPSTGHIPAMTKADVMDRYFAGLDSAPQVDPEIWPYREEIWDDTNTNDGCDDDCDNECDDELCVCKLDVTGKSMDINIVTEFAAFEWLQGALYSEARQTPAVPNIRRSIREKVIYSLHGANGLGDLNRDTSIMAHEIMIEVDWDPKSFVDEQQYDGRPGTAIAAAITLTGSAQNCQAMTTSQYISHTWKSTGEQMMKLIQRVLDGQEGDEHSCELLA